MTPGTGLQAVATKLSNSNYKLPDNPTITYEIEKGTLTGIEVTPFTGMSDGDPHDTIVDIKGILPTDKVEYSYSEDGIHWSTPNAMIPQIKTPGTMYVQVIVHRENYEDSIITVQASILSGPKAYIEVPIYDANDATSLGMKGTVVKGYYEIAKQVFTYRKLGDSQWIDIPTIGEIVTLNKLDTGVVYEFKLTVTDVNGNQDEAYRKVMTNSENKVTGKIEGSVSGGAGKEFAVTLELGNTIVSSIEGLHQDDTFSFSNLPDGEYNLVATDGEYHVTYKVTVTDGKTMAVGLLFVGCKQTSVEVEEDAPDIAADGLNDLFEEDIFKSNEEATKAVEEGGTVEIVLKANKDSNEEIQKKIRDEADANDQIVGLYIDFTVDMIITPLGGHSTSLHLTDTEKLIQIAIPLSKSQQGKEGYRMYRNHEGVVSSMKLLTGEEKVHPTGEGFYVENGYAYVWARYFSTYAIAYNRSTEKDPVNPIQTPTPDTPKEPDIEKNGNHLKSEALEVKSNDSKDTDNKKSDGSKASKKDDSTTSTTGTKEPEVTDTNGKDNSKKIVDEKKRDTSKEDIEEPSKSDDSGKGKVEGATKSPVSEDSETACHWHVVHC